jgi:hypothetical protein
MGRHVDRLRQNDGSSLVTVLVLVVLLTTMAGLVLAILAAQQRFMRVDVHHLQAFYAAEAGLYLAASEISMSSGPLDKSYAVGDASTRVEASLFGGFAYVSSEGYARGQRARIAAVAAAVPPEAFDTAIWIGDPSSGLVTTGDARINGRIVVGRTGLQTAHLGGIPHTGEVTGAIIASDTVAMPPFDAAALRAAMEYLESTTSRSELHVPGFGRLPVLHLGGNARVSERDSAMITGPVVLASTGSMVVEGDLRLAQGSVILSGHDLVIDGHVRGENLIVYAADSLVIGGASALSGQFLAGLQVVVKDSARLRYPSLVFADGDPFEYDHAGGIRIIGNAKLDGIALLAEPHITAQLDQSQDQRLIEIGQDAHVRGAVYSGARANVRGRIDGTICTRAFYFYEAPSHHVNWIRDAKVDRSRRPESFLVPLGFTPGRELRIAYQVGL